MSNKCTEADLPTELLTNEFARQRWELFHRAIAFAKQTNDAAMLEPDAGNNESTPGGPALTIVR